MNSESVHENPVSGFTHYHAKRTQIHKNDSLSSLLIDANFKTIYMWHRDILA